MIQLAFIPSDELNFTTVETDIQRLAEYCRQLKTPVLKLDLSGVRHCDSAGLAFLIEARRLAREFHKAFRIDGMSKSIRSLAEFCGVEGILTDGGSC